MAWEGQRDVLVAGLLRITVDDVAGGEKMSRSRGAHSEAGQGKNQCRKRVVKQQEDVNERCVHWFSSSYARGSCP